jgi:hypothetical protein
VAPALLPLKMQSAPCERGEGRTASPDRHPRANDAIPPFCAYVVRTWRADVSQVTNDSDKENHLPKILSYHAEVQKAFAAASDANDPCSHTRVQPLANPEVARNK